MRCPVIFGPSTHYAPFPFHEPSYHRMQLVDEPYGPMKIYQDPSAQFTGIMVFKRGDDPDSEAGTKVLEMFVAGDTAINIYTLVNGQQLERPMVHDVAFSIIAQAAMSDPQRWGLLRVAIVGLKDDVFVGRLFFGDPVTQEVFWDCDCRPSDGCFLSIKCNAPLYVHDTVWEGASKRVEDSTVYMLLLEAAADQLREEAAAQVTEEAEAAQQAEAEQQELTEAVTGDQAVPPQEQPGGTGGLNLPEPVGWAGAHDAVLAASTTPKALARDFSTTIIRGDLDAIKLLKRKLALAVAEEDYSSAVSIRDHPHMRLYRVAFEARLSGRMDDAVAAEADLWRAVFVPQRSEK